MVRALESGTSDTGDEEWGVRAAAGGYNGGAGDLKINSGINTYIL